jgi:amidophosphoribosyltransferase
MTEPKERYVPRGDGSPQRHPHHHPQQPAPRADAAVGEPEVRDECGVFGVWAPGEDVAKLTYFGLFALQHRGQEAAGIAVSDGSGIVVYKDLGLVAQVFDEPTLASLRGHLAIGHTRYSTTGAPTWENAQPTIRATSAGTSIALAHNGNLVNTAQLAQQVSDQGLGGGAMASTTDTGLVTTLLAAHPDLPVEQAALQVLPTLRGAFSFVFLDESTLYAARDAAGVRPLVLGRLERGWVVASETAALDIVGATAVREVEPGELLAIDEHGLRSTRFAAPEPKGCLFEYVYLARPDSNLAGRNVYAARVAIGRALAREHPAEADMVIGVPESGIPAAIGYAEESGTPYGAGLVKNAYVGRTFIEPSQTIRQLGIRLKLNPLRENVRGKRLVVVDDTIVRGNTQRAIVRMLREAGAVEVHVRISAPPVQWPCFYGIDFATRAELIANGMDTEGIRRSISADSLGYVSLDGLVAATEQPRTRLCRACFDGEYPIELPAGHLIGKHVLEGVDRRVAGTLPVPEAASAHTEPESTHRREVYSRGGS